MTTRTLSILAMLTNDKAIFGLIFGLPVIVAVLAIIWLRPRDRAPVWGLATLLLIAIAVGGAWLAFHGRSTEAAASSPGGPAAPPPASCSPSGTTLHVTAKGTAFDTSCLAAPTGEAFTIDFSNMDAGTSHSVHILTANPASDPSAKTLFQGQIVTGPTTITYQVGALPAGTYYFHCDVHPTAMQGTFLVK